MRNLVVVVVVVVAAAAAAAAAAVPVVVVIVFVSKFKTCTTKCASCLSRKYHQHLINGVASAVAKQPLFIQNGKYFTVETECTFLRRLYTNNI